MTKILVVAGARPNFVKVAPLLKELDRRRTAGAAIEIRFVDTGQHYDFGLAQSLFQDLELPEPDYHLDVRSGTHAQQTAKVMLGFEPVCLREMPSMVVVVGDVNSTLACALVAAKLDIPVMHVEAGLRSNDPAMPEEINRVLTDHLSSGLFTPSSDANDNLAKEGIPRDRIFLVGNIMVDALLAHRERAQTAGMRERLSLTGSPYAVLTLHRPSNVDAEPTLRRLLEAISAIPIPVVFPVHPRTKSRMEAWRLTDLSGAMRNVRLIEPVGYRGFVELLEHASLVLTDSGGIQEETTVLNVPCLTMRENTERPITVTHGTNTIVGTDPATILQEARAILANGGKRGAVPPLWDGQAAERIVDILMRDTVTAVHR